MKKLISVFLALALLLAVSVSAAEQVTATSLGGVKMGMSLEQAKAIMGEETLFEDQITDNVTEADFEIEYAGGTANAGFIFADNSLIMVGVYNFKTLEVKDIDSIKQEMTAAYGMPGVVAPETIARLFETISGENTPLIFSEAAEWHVDGDATAWIFVVSQDDASQIYVVYLSNAYLASNGFGTEEPKTETPAAGSDVVGTWKLTDVESETASEEEVNEAKAMLQSGDLVQMYTFNADGTMSATMQMPQYGMDQTISGTYQISGNTIIVTENGEDSGSDPVEYEVNGDILKLITAEAIMYLTRQN